MRYIVLEKDFDYYYTRSGDHGIGGGPAFGKKSGYSVYDTWAVVDIFKVIYDRRWGKERAQVVASALCQWENGENKDKKIDIGNVINDLQVIRFVGEKVLLEQTDGVRFFKPIVDLYPPRLQRVREIQI